MTLLLAGRKDAALPFLEKADQENAAKSPLATAIRKLESGQDAEPVAVSMRPSAEELYYLALVDLKRGDKRSAIGNLRQAIVLQPDYARAHQKMAELADRPAEALEHWRAAALPNNVTALRAAAWILATNGELHNGVAALELAKRAAMLTQGRDGAALDVLAAAYAEAGQFEDAIATARRAVAEDPSRAKAIERRIDQYRAGKPWRE